MLKRQLSKTGERLELELLVAGTEFAELERTVYKATKANTKAPKEKHVQKILSYLHRGVSEKQTQIVLKVLARRFKESSQGTATHFVPGAQAAQQNHWTVIKTLVVWNRVLRSADRTFSERCAPYTENIFAALSGGYAHERLKGSNMSAFCYDYAMHIKIKIQINAKLRYIWDQEATDLEPRFATIQIPQLMEEMPLIIKMLDTLTRCKIQGRITDMHVAYQQAHELLMFDVKMVDRNMKAGLGRLTEKYKEFSDRDMHTFAKLYRKYVDNLEKLITWLENIPTEVNVSPGTVLETMRERFMDCSHDDSPTGVKCVEKWFRDHKSEDYRPDSSPKREASTARATSRTALEAADAWADGQYAPSKAPNEGFKFDDPPAVPARAKPAPQAPPPEPAAPTAQMFDLSVSNASGPTPLFEPAPVEHQEANPFGTAAFDFNAPSPFGAPAPTPAAAAPAAASPFGASDPFGTAAAAPAAAAPAAASPFGSADPFQATGAAPAPPPNPFAATPLAAPTAAAPNPFLPTAPKPALPSPQQAQAGGLFLPAPVNKPPPAFTPAPAAASGSLI